MCDAGVIQKMNLQYNTNLPTLWDNNKYMHYPLRTMLNSYKPPKTNTSINLCDISVIFDNIDKTVMQLKRLDLYDISYLHRRKNIYYFTIRVNNRVIRYSLKTSNKTIAILLKLKILHHLNITHQLRQKIF